eukprot:COSAG01_NODE_10_length_42970_cov_93.010007_50_plen_59_part_00
MHPKHVLNLAKLVKKADVGLDLLVPAPIDLRRWQSNRCFEMAGAVLHLWRMAIPHGSL